MVPDVWTAVKGWWLKIFECNKILFLIFKYLTISSETNDLVKINQYKRSFNSLNLYTRSYSSSDFHNHITIFLNYF